MPRAVASVLADSLAWALAGALAIALAGPAAAHVRLHNPANGKPLYWDAPQSISVVLQLAGSDDIGDASDDCALRNAIASWDALDGCASRLIEDSEPEQRARTDWQANDLHTLMFDEDASSGYFPPGSGIVAVTPVWFASDGRILDADVLFNGWGFAFATEQSDWTFDVQDVAAHELGHLLGLDHSGNVAASLYPYVDPSVLLHRSPAADDACGLRAIAPQGAGFGAIAGRVERASGQGVAGALVVARDEGGRAIASVLSDSHGHFELELLPAGEYRVFARPLDEPVSQQHLTDGWQIATDFAPSALSGWLEVSSAHSTPAPDLVVGADVELNLGRSSNVLPLHVEPGSSASFALSGSGLWVGCALACSLPGASASVTGAFGGSLQFTLAIPPDAAEGEYDLAVTGPGGAQSVLVGAVCVTPPAPEIDALVPNAIDAAGGGSLRVLGSGFRPTTRVVIGEQIYSQAAGTLSWIDAGELELAFAATSPGVHTVVAIDASGVEGRLEHALQVQALPSIASVFPSAGSASGGTEVVLSGSHFDAGLSVRIDGIEQHELVVESATRVRLSSSAGLPGGPYLLELENPDGSLATAVFSYTAEPDPDLVAVSPGVARPGDELVLSGQNFSGALDVRIGADPDTGLGGVLASASFVDEQHLSVLVPDGVSGPVSVLVCTPLGQASVLPNALEVEADSGGGGGGCAGLVGVPHGPASGRELGAGAWWMAALLLACAWGRRGARSVHRAE